MKHKNILKRAWHVLWNYKGLWIFGMVLALTTASYSGQSRYNLNDNDVRNDRQELNFNSSEDFTEWAEAQVDEAVREFDRIRRGVNLTNREQRIINIVIAVLCVIVALIPVAKVLNYVSETSLIKMVDEHEETGIKHKFKAGFALGWSKEAWKLFLVDLVISLPLFILTAGALALAAWPLLAGFFGSKMRNILALVSSIGLFFVVILLAAVISAFIRLLKQFIRRKVVLEQKGVMAAIKEGSKFAWQNFKDVGLMWLIIVGINIAWPIVLIPIGALLFAIGAAGGGLLALATYAISSGSVAAVSILGGGFFTLALSLPLIFIGGLKATFLSSTWTLSYRELKAMKSMELEPGTEDTQAEVIAE